MNELNGQISEELDHSLGFATKLLASGVFVGEREPEHFAANDLHAPHDFDPAALNIVVDRSTGRVTLTLPNGYSRTAVCHPGLGCTLLPAGEESIFFNPVPVTSSLPPAEEMQWPMGDIGAVHTPANLNARAMEGALDFTFDETHYGHPQRARAMVVLHKGKIVGERYAPGWGQESKLVSWSMGKSITAALIGMLISEGEFSLDDPAPVPDWREPGDPRGPITIRHLLNMSSGLEFNRVEGDADPKHFTVWNDHNYIYFGAVNVFEHSLSRPVEHETNTVWRYRNCDPLTLGFLVKQGAEARGEEYLTWPQRKLFDRIGIRNIVLEPDAWGNFVNTGFDHGTARDWARFGLLHLQDGIWQGERILPEGWVETISTPAPADPDRHYGGQFWLNAGGTHPDIPRDAYWCAGARGQTTMVIPSRDSVIVRLGHSLDSESHGRYLNDYVREVLAAIG